MIKRKLFIIISIIMFLILVIFIVPVIKWILPYNIPDNLSPQETISHYFDALDDNNPKKARQYFINEDDGIFTTFDLLGYQSIKVKNIKTVEEGKSYVVLSFEVISKEWFFNFSKLEMWSYYSNARLEKIDDKWRILDIYPGD